MSTQPANNDPMPSASEVMEAQLILLDGVRAVETGCWDASMQPERDQAREVVKRARAAGIL